METTIQMDTILQILNAFAYLALGGVAAHLYLDPEFDDGILMKLGLGMFALSCGASFALMYDGMDAGEATYLTRAAFGRNLGLLIVLGAWWLRHGRVELATFGKRVRVVFSFLSQPPWKRNKP